MKICLKKERKGTNEKGRREKFYLMCVFLEHWYLMNVVHDSSMKQTPSTSFMKGLSFLGSKVILAVTPRVHCYVGGSTGDTCICKVSKHHRIGTQEQS